MNSETTTAGGIANATDIHASPAEAGPSTDPKLGDVTEEEYLFSKDTTEEAKTREHQMTHLPTNPFCDVS